MLDFALRHGLPPTKHTIELLRGPSKTMAGFKLEGTIDLTQNQSDISFMGPCTRPKCFQV